MLSSFLTPISIEETAFYWACDHSCCARLHAQYSKLRVLGSLRRYYGSAMLKKAHRQRQWLYMRRIICSRELPLGYSLREDEASDL
jgi:hypothetical protein